MSTAADDIVQKAAEARSFTRDGFIFFGIGVAVTLARTYARWDMAGFKRFQADDYLVWLALILYSGETASNYLFVKDSRGLANNGMTDEERAALDPASLEFAMREKGSKANFAAWPQYAVLMWSLKAAMCVYYLRLMERSKYRNRIFVGFGMIGVSFVAVILVIFASCTPITKWWQIYPDPGPLCYSVSSPAILWTFLACNIITDVYIIWLPMPMLFKSTLPMPTKIALATLFGCGIFVAIAGILRVTTIVYSPHDLHHISFWAVRETFVGIVTTNLPFIFVLVRRWTSPFFSLLRSHSFGSNGKTKLSRPKSTHWAGQGQGQGRHGGALSAKRTSAHKPSPGAGRGQDGFPMDQMGTFAMAEGNSSQERIMQDLADYGGDGGGGGLGTRLGRKVSMKRVKNPRAPRAGEHAVEHDGIQKMVDITIVEEHRPAVYDIADEEAGRNNNNLPDFPDPPGPVYERR